MKKRCERGLRTKNQFKKSYSDVPLVTVVTVVYNGEEHIEKTLKSVLDQTYDNIEYIVIDGGSTDKTVDIIKKYEDQIDYWISEADDGIYDAMNKGIKVANGESIGLLNAGDKYYPDTIEKIIKSGKALSHSIVTGNMIKFTENGDTEFISQRSKNDLRNSMKSMPLNHPSTFVGKGVYESIGLFDTSYKICGDNEFIVRAQENNINIFFLQENLSKMQLGGVSETIGSLFIRTREHFRIRKNYNVSSVINMYETGKYFIINFLKNSLKVLLPSKFINYYYQSKR